jgi:hypothetical protein
VPPPRPVAATGSGQRESPWTGAGAAEESGGLAGAARAVADAVNGLLGSSGTGRGAVAGVLRDVVSAVTAAGIRRGASPGNEPGNEPGNDLGGAASGRAPTAALGDLLAAAAPRLPVRDRARLRQAYPGASDEEIADALVARAVRLTSGIGAATGGLSAAQWFAPPSLLALPIELAAETVLTAAVELTLVGELHELYGRPARGNPRERAAGYLSAWSEQKSVDVTTGSLAAVIGNAGQRALRRRLSRRLARSVGAAAPFLVGAAISGHGNRRATEALAERLRADLRRGRPSGGAGGGEPD